MKESNLIYINDQFKNHLLKTKLNTLIDFDKTDNKFYFLPKQGKKSEIKIRQIKLANGDFNKQFLAILSNYIRSSLKASKSISNEPIIYDKSDIKKLKSTLSSLVYKYSYFDFKNMNIFDLFTDIFIRFLTGHYLKNGNKRFAFIFLIQLLFAFGYYFKYSKGSKQNYKRYTDQITNFTIKLENNRDMDSSNNKVRSRIKKWILKQIIVGIPWYNKLYKQFLKAAK